MRHPLRLAVALIAAGTLAAGCGGKSNNQASNGVSANASGAATGGNDASTSEMVNQPSAPTPPAATPTPTPSPSTNGAGAAGNTGATPPVDTDTPPGGDTGGNSSDKETPGM